VNAIPCLLNNIIRKSEEFSTCAEGVNLLNGLSGGNFSAIGALTQDATQALKEINSSIAEYIRQNSSLDSESVRDLSVLSNVSEIPPGYIGVFSPQIDKIKNIAIRLVQDHGSQSENFSQSQMQDSALSFNRLPELYVLPLEMGLPDSLDSAQPSVHSVSFSGGLESVFSSEGLDETNPSIEDPTLKNSESPNTGNKVLDDLLSGYETKATLRFFEARKRPARNFIYALKWFRKNKDAESLVRLMELAGPNYLSAENNRHKLSPTQILQVIKPYDELLKRVLECRFFKLLPRYEDQLQKLVLEKTEPSDTPPEDAAPLASSSKPSARGSDSQIDVEQDGVESDDAASDGDVALESSDSDRSVTFIRKQRQIIDALLEKGDARAILDFFKKSKKRRSAHSFIDVFKWICKNGDAESLVELMELAGPNYLSVENNRHKLSLKKILKMIQPHSELSTRVLRCGFLKSEPTYEARLSKKPKLQKRGRVTHSQIDTLLTKGDASAIIEFFEDGNRPDFNFIAAFKWAKKNKNLEVLVRLMELAPKGYLSKESNRHNTPLLVILEDVSLNSVLVERVLESRFLDSSEKYKTRFEQLIKQAKAKRGENNPQNRYSSRQSKNTKRNSKK
jgi:hypothetical protein